MSLHPQYTFDKAGNPTGFFLPIEDWYQLTEEMHIEIPEWQKKLMDSRLDEYNKSPGSTLNWDEIEHDLRKEDEAI